MLKNIILTAWRNLKKRKGYAFINITGLAIGMACCLLILFYVKEELSYDRQHPDFERIHRVALDIRSGTSNRVFANASATLAPALKKEFPQIETAFRLFKTENRLVSDGGEKKVYEKNFFYADPEALQVLYLPLIAGNPQEALIRPATVIISESLARKYFGEANPIGKTLIVADKNHEVTGVFTDAGYNSHVKFDLIASFATLAGWPFLDNWFLTVFHNYIKVKPNVDLEDFKQKIEHAADAYVNAELKEQGISFHYFLQPLASIHLRSHLNSELEAPGNIQTVYILSVVAALILLVASLNFVNLSTAQAAQRSKEVGIRKVVGSDRKTLVIQFLGESLLLALTALAFAVLLIDYALPWFNAITGYHVQARDLLQSEIVAGMLLLILLAGVGASFFPAWMLSSFNPVNVLKGQFRSGARAVALRKVLVTSQFVISLLLIAGTLTGFRQIQFMKNQNLGFDKEQMLVLPIRGQSSFHENHESIKNEFLKHPAIIGATASSNVPGRGVSNFAIELINEADKKNQSMYYAFVDHDFVRMFGIEIVAGRAFQRDITTDAENAFLINEAGLKAFGWTAPEEALGKRIQTGFEGRQGEIVGVYKNFNFRSLQYEVEPLVLAIHPPWFSYLTLKVSAADMPATIALVHEQWRRFFPQNPFEYFFLDDDFDRQYRADERMATVILVFTCLAIGVACLGLFGLAAFVTVQRTKEIGVRKTLGATIGSIVLLLTRDFLLLVAIAAVIATPIIYLVLSRWLENFAYRVELDAGVFFISAILAGMIALFTVSFHAIKAARANPANSLRYE